MGRYTTDGNTTLTLDDGRSIAPGETFEADFTAEKAAFLLACGAVTVAVVPAAAEIHESATAGDPGPKE